MSNRRTFIHQSARAIAAGLSGSAIRAEDDAGISDPKWRELKNWLGGRLMSQCDPRYIDRSLQCNLRYDNVSPQRIAMCISAEDVQACIQWVKKHNMEFAVRSGGHSYAAFSSSRGLMIDVSRMKSLHVDRANGTLTIGTGINGADLVRMVRPEGVMIPTGICPAVGVSGLCLGGGWGYFAREHGVTCDSLVETEIVTADGERRTCNPRENPDLFWALRGGGGGNFGVNTSMTFKTFPVKDSCAFQAHWYSLNPVALISHVQQALEESPNSIGARLLLITPLVTGTNRPIIQLVGNNHGANAAETRKALKHVFTYEKPFQQSFESLDFWQAHDVLADAMPYDTSFQIKSAFVEKAMTEKALARMIDWLQRWPGSTFDPVWITGFFLVGGAVNTPSRTQTAYVHRDSNFLMVLQTNWDGNAQQRLVTQNQSWISDYFEDMQDHVRPESYQNFPDLSRKDWASAYYAENFERLKEIKAHYDPQNLFRFAHSIPVKS